MRSFIKSFQRESISNDEYLPQSPMAWEQNHRGPRSVAAPLHRFLHLRRLEPTTYVPADEAQNTAFRLQEVPW